MLGLTQPPKLIHHVLIILLFDGDVSYLLRYTSNQATSLRLIYLIQHFHKQPPPTLIV